MKHDDRDKEERKAVWGLIVFGAGYLFAIWLAVYLIRAALLFLNR
jgi:hypothetical protein